MIWLLTTWAIGAAALLLFVFAIFWSDPPTTERASFLAIGSAIALAWLPTAAALIPGAAIFYATAPRRRRRSKPAKLRTGKDPLGELSESLGAGYGSFSVPIGTRD